MILNKRDQARGTLRRLHGLNNNPRSMTIRVNFERPLCPFKVVRDSDLFLKKKILKNINIPKA